MPRTVNRKCILIKKSLHYKQTNVVQAQDCDRRAKTHSKCTRELSAPGGCALVLLLNKIKFDTLETWMILETLEGGDISQRSHFNTEWRQLLIFFTVCILKLCYSLINRLFDVRETHRLVPVCF